MFHVSFAVRKLTARRGLYPCESCVPPGTQRGLGGGHSSAQRGFNLLVIEHTDLCVHPKRYRSLFGSGGYNFDLIQY